MYKHEKTVNIIKKKNTINIETINALKKMKIIIFAPH